MRAHYYIDSELRALVNQFRQERKKLPSALVLHKEELSWILDRSQRITEDDNGRLSFFYCHECWIPVETAECLGALQVRRRDFECKE